MQYLVMKIQKMDKNLFRSFYQVSLKEMGKFIIKKNKPDIAGILLEHSLITVPK